MERDPELDCLLHQRKFTYVDLFKFWEVGLSQSLDVGYKIRHFLIHKYVGQCLPERGHPTAQWLRWMLSDCKLFILLFT
jgi:hypothetical protein